MSLLNNALYINEMDHALEWELPWDILENKSILLSGATGLIGSYLIDLIMWRNDKKNMNCKVYAIGRSAGKANSRFQYWAHNELFEFIEADINRLADLPAKTADYVLHLASNTHPVAYSTKPIETITTNIIGTKNMLEIALAHESKRFLLASSVEIYGENRGDVDKFDEEYCGFIDSNTLRAGYPESKRCGEALCQAYIKEKKIDAVIPRFSRTYGPTMLMSDTKALSQFLKKGIAGEDIILKSAGSQNYSYSYVGDAVFGLLTVLLRGNCGEAYNISSSDVTLKELAEIVASASNQKVIYEKPDDIEAAGYSKATKALLDSTKIEKIGWAPYYDIRRGIEQTIKITRGTIG